MQTFHFREIILEMILGIPLRTKVLVDGQAQETS